MENETNEVIETTDIVESSSSEILEGKERAMLFAQTFRELFVALGMVINAKKLTLGKPFCQIDDPNANNIEISPYYYSMTILNGIKDDFQDYKKRSFFENFDFGQNKILQTMQGALIKSLNQALIDDLESRITRFMEEPQRAKVLDMLYEFIVENFEYLEALLAHTTDFAKFDFRNMDGMVSQIYREDEFYSGHLYYTFVAISYLLKELLIWEEKLDGTLSQKEYLREVSLFMSCVEKIYEWKEKYPFYFEARKY